MPKKGISRCGCGWNDYWLIEDNTHSRQYLVECKKCGTQRYTKAKFTWLYYKVKPKKDLTPDI